MPTPLGIAVRSMGPQSAPDVLLACVRAAEEAGLADVWVQDHVAIPPDDAEGSNGRYLDPLTTLSWLAGQTSRIGLGTGVLILPYRPPLPTAKAIATLQELSGNRLRLGVGVGWMKPEFRALGVPREQRGRLTDEALALLHACFAEGTGDVVTAHDQPFLFRPRPPRPPIYVGGAGEHALARAVRYGDGWMPMMAQPEAIAEAATRLRALARESGRPAPEVVAFAGFDPRDPAAARAHARALVAAGATRLVAGVRYADAQGFRHCVEFLAGEVAPALA